MLKLFIFCISVLFLIEDASTDYCKADDQYPWSYHGEKNGPENWVDKYPDCGEGDQSPIDIKHIDRSGLPKLKYNNFNKPITKAVVQNVGWTVMVTPKDGTKRSIKLDSLTLILDEIHFHFGSESQPGAEHALNGTLYEMEIHYVTHLDGDDSALAIVASLMKASDDNNSAFDPIVKVISNVKYRDDSTNLNSDLNLVDLLPKDSGTYYYYEGSDSIPPCESGYIWLILKEIGNVGSNQLYSFLSSLYSVGKKDASYSCLMGPNKRPLQDLDNREILSSE